MSVQSAANIAGRDAAITGNLFTLFLWITGFMLLLVVGFLLAAAMRRHRAAADTRPGPAEGPLRVTLIAWSGLIVAGLLLLVTASYLTDRALAKASPDPTAARVEPLRIKVTAQQWWWEIEYADPYPPHRIRTANELVLPVDAPAQVRLESIDVIHSFWVPNLAGKQDLIPGRVNVIRLFPRRVGHYRGQCAEFCGTQHAHMAFDVTVLSRDDFEAWRKRQLRPAAPPSTSLAKAGHDIFMSRQCAMCHAIAGTPAQGQVAPDLTHFASRRTIAAGTAPNNRGYRMAWLADPQKMKPGSNMPYIGLEPTELDALDAYLETLK